MKVYEVFKNSQNRNVLVCEINGLKQCKTIRMSVGGKEMETDDFQIIKPFRCFMDPKTFLIFIDPSFPVKPGDEIELR